MSIAQTIQAAVSQPLRDPPPEAHNPFVWPAGITEAEAFFNREHESGMVRDFLGKRQNVQIVGPRRIGKTSLLLHVQRHGFRVVHVDRSRLPGLARSALCRLAELAPSAGPAIRLERRPRRSRRVCGAGRGDGSGRAPPGDLSGRSRGVDRPRRRVLAGVLPGPPGVGPERVVDHHGRPPTAERTDGRNGRRGIAVLQHVPAIASRSFSARRCPRFRGPRSRGVRPFSEPNGARSWISQAATRSPCKPPATGCWTAGRTVPAASTPPSAPPPTTCRLSPRLGNPHAMIAYLRWSLWQLYLFAFWPSRFEREVEGVRHHRLSYRQRLCIC